MGIRKGKVGETRNRFGARLTQPTLQEMNQKPLWNIGWRYLLRHPWQSVLMVLGIVLGVAVVVAIDLANASASRAFDLSTQSITGRATHQVVNGALGVPEQVYTKLRRSGKVQAAPVISEYVSSPQLGNRPIQLLGIDPFAEAPFRDYLGGAGGQVSSSRPAPATGDLATFLSQPGALFISTEMADRYGVTACNNAEIASSPGIPTHCRIEIEVGGYNRTAFIAGLLQPVDSLSQRALSNLILADISTAQELTGKLGKLDRIDLILPNPAAVAEAQALLPKSVQLETVAARNGTVEQMTSAFRVNLTALSLLALVVGMFLIYNSMTFSVIQRRTMFGTLRSLGVTRREIFSLVAGEAVLIGGVGALLGIGLGILMGQGAVQMVTQTINDLFFVLNVRGIQVPLSSLVKGGALGVLATVFSALPPAWEAASVPPRAALSRSGLESKVRRAVRQAAVLGAALLLVGAAVLMVPTHSLTISFGGTFAVIVGCAALAPILTGWAMRVIIPLSGRLGGTLGRMAPRDVINSLSRTAVAVAALMVAVSVTIGVSLMVSSFRYTVVQWLDQTLQGDIYISAPGPTSNRSWTPISPEIARAVREWPGVQRADVVESVNVESPQGPVHVVATNNYSLPQERLFLSRAVPQTEIWQEMQKGAVLVSEPFANRFGVSRKGGKVVLETEMGRHVFPVAGIVYDYASTEGVIFMDIGLYRKYWQDPNITAIALRLEPGADPDHIVKELQDRLAGGQAVLIRANRTLRQDVLTIFDRTFAITGALQLLATMVAFIGVLSALLSLELERQRELGILRAIGLTVRQLWGLVMLETGLLGMVAGLLSMPTGYVLSLILIYIINRRSFGWTLQMQVQAEPFLLALVVAVTAALLAGIYPAIRIGNMATSEALRSE